MDLDDEELKATKQMNNTNKINIQEDIKILKEMLNNTKKNRRGHEEIRFEVNSVYYRALENILEELATKRILEYIEQLETKNQKLIEKLEEDKDKFAKENKDGDLQAYVDEILEMMKGENEKVKELGWNK